MKRPSSIGASILKKGFLFLTFANGAIALGVLNVENTKLSLGAIACTALLFAVEIAYDDNSEVDMIDRGEAAIGRLFVFAINLVALLVSIVTMYV